MPTYVFEDTQTRQRVEHAMPMARAPKYGQVVTVGGRKLRRVVEDSVQVTGGFKPYVTRVAPKHTPGFKHTDKGHCIVETRGQEAHYAKATGLEWE